MATRTFDETPGSTFPPGYGRPGHAGTGDGGQAGVNVGTLERWASLLGGGALMVGGLSRGGAAGLTTAALGGVLAQRGLTGHCQLYEALGVQTADEAEAAQRGAAGLIAGAKPVHVEAVATVARPAAELFEFWRRPANLPRFMKSLESARKWEDGRATWTVRPPVGPGIEFDTVVTHEREGELLAWRSVDTDLVEHTGSVHFTEMPHGRGTAVRMRMDFTPPAGALGAGVARLFDGAMEMQLRAELKRFKQLMETGEVATTEGQPSGRED